jgi:hypothetical protein
MGGRHSGWIDGASGDYRSGGDVKPVARPLPGDILVAFAGPGFDNPSGCCFPFAE